MTRRKRIGGVEKVAVRLSQRERDIVIKYTFIPQELYSAVQAARRRGDWVTVWLTVEDLDELLGFIAAEANHAKSKPIEQAFDDLYERLQDQLEYEESRGKKAPGVTDDEPKHRRIA